jgi:tryptophanyl-tRNA synthetase
VSERPGRPTSALAAEPSRDVYVFVADLHALNTRPEPAALREQSRRLAAALLACGWTARTCTCTGRAGYPQSPSWLHF